MEPPKPRHTAPTGQTEFAEERSPGQLSQFPVPRARRCDPGNRRPIDWAVSGDEWGADPHDVSGSTSIVPVELTSFTVE
jgi:hypothetical protein